METVLQHHGILGMKWGVRRYQNKDGTLTSEGKARYNREAYKSYAKLSSSERRKAASSMSDEEKGNIRDGAMQIAKRRGSMFGALALPSGISIDTKLKDLNANYTDAQKKGKSYISRNSTKSVAVLTHEEAQRLGLGDDTRITGDEEMRIWQQLAAQYERQNK